MPAVGTDDRKNYPADKALVSFRSQYPKADQFGQGDRRLRKFSAKLTIAVAESETFDQVEVGEPIAGQQGLARLSGGKILRINSA